MSTGGGDGLRGGKALAGAAGATLMDGCRRGREDGGTSDKEAVGEA